MVSFCNSIVSLPHLQCLNMTYMHIDDSSLGYFSATLSHSSFASSLRTLDLSHNEYSASGIERLTSAFPHLSSLHELSLCSVTAASFLSLPPLYIILLLWKSLSCHVDESFSVTAISAGHPSFLDALARSGALICSSVLESFRAPILPCLSLPFVLAALP